MSANNKRPHIKKVIHAAARCGLFVLAEGSGKDFRYEFWDKKTGKKVLTYYQASGHWMTPDKQGRADDYRGALDAISSEHRRDSRTDNNKPHSERREQGS